jgi:uncharacterized phage protein (TIGR01671 family)
MMNRLIEVRAWDKKEKKYIYGEMALHYLSQYQGQYSDRKYEPYIFEEFTGLKDKNGTPIYEGDIIKFTVIKSYGFHCAGGQYENNKKTCYKAVIEFDNSAYRLSKCYCYGVENLLCKWGRKYNEKHNESLVENSSCRTERIGGHDIVMCNNFYVIGNIYENPELLNEST